MKIKNSTIQEIEALYYDTDIPDTTETKAARRAFEEAVKQGNEIREEERLVELETANEKQGFVSGFRCAARMFGLLMEARG